MDNAVPFQGLGPFVLGKSREQIKSQAGEPEAIREERFSDDDDSKDEIWSYQALGIEVAFSDADDWRLASITIASPDVSILGARLVGLPASDVVAAANKAGIDDLIQADDVEDGCLCYTSDAHGLMLWAVDGVVASVTLFPRYDETGDVPCWPA